MNATTTTTTTDAETDDDPALDRFDTFVQRLAREAALDAFLGDHELMIELCLRGLSYDEIAMRIEDVTGFVVPLNRVIVACRAAGISWVARPLSRTYTARITDRLSADALRSLVADLALATDGAFESGAGA